MNQKWLNWIIIIGVIVLALVIIFVPKTSADAELAKCIGNNSKLYTITGCIHCEQQKELFGNNFQYLNITNGNSWEELAKYNVTETPTWEINGSRYYGVQDINTLKKLTGC